MFGIFIEVEIDQFVDSFYFVVVVAQINESGSVALEVAWQRVLKTSVIFSSKCLSNDRSVRFDVSTTKHQNDVDRHKMSYKNVSSQLCRPVSFVSSSLQNASFSSSSLPSSASQSASCSSSSAAALIHHHPHLHRTHPHVPLLSSSQSTSYGSEATAPLSTVTHLSTDSSTGSAFDLPDNSDDPPPLQQPQQHQDLNNNHVVATSSTSPTTNSHTYTNITTTAGGCCNAITPQQTSDCSIAVSAVSFDHRLQSPGEATLLLNYRQLLDPTPASIHHHQSHYYPIHPQQSANYSHQPYPQASYQYHLQSATSSDAPSLSGQLYLSGDRRNSTATYTYATTPTPTQPHVYQHVSSTETVPVTWRRIHEHVRHLCAAHLTCVLLVLLPVLLAALLICAFVLQERSDKQHLHQYAIYAFIVFCVAFICPFALFFVLVLVNKAVRKYHKCFHPHLAAAAEFAEYGFNPYPHFAFTFPASGYPVPAGVTNNSGTTAGTTTTTGTASYAYHWPLSSAGSCQLLSDAAVVAAAAATVGIQLAPHEAAQLLQQTQRPISTLNVQQLGANTATGSGTGSAGTPGATGTGSAGRLSGSSVSSLLLGSETDSSSGRHRQRMLVRQDAFECPVEYPHLPDSCAPYHAHDQPPSYELALLCPISKSIDESTSGGSIAASTSSSGSGAQAKSTSASTSNHDGSTSNEFATDRRQSIESSGGKRSPKAEEQTPPPPYDEKTMSFR